MDNYIVIGDIHGRFDLLERLLDKIKADPVRLNGSRLVFLGDMVDRGPDSFKVVAKIKELCETSEAIALMGNHEHMMLDFYKKRYSNKSHIWMVNGAPATIRSYGKAMKSYGTGHFFRAFEQSGHAAWMQTLPLYYETDKVWFSHAPVPRKRAQATENPRDYRDDVHALIWSFEERFLEGKWELEHGKLAVSGHIHALFDKILEPRIYDHIIYADTGSGCAPHGPLTGIIINDGKYAGYLQALPHELEGK